jgi:hypothetical protein
VVARVLEDARRPAVEQDREPLQLLGGGRHREAVAAGDVADDRVDVLALHEVAVLAHLLRRAARLVDDDELQRAPADALLRVRRRHLPGVERLGEHLAAVLRRDAERARRRAREEGDDADAERLPRSAGGRLRGRERRGEEQHGDEKIPGVHHPSSMYHQ